MFNDDIKALPKDSSFDGVFILNDPNLRQNGEQAILTGKLMDKTGSIPFKFTEYVLPEGKTLQDLRGKVVRVNGTTDVFRGEPQANLTELTLIEDPEKDPSVNVKDLVAQAPIDQEAYFDYLVKTGEELEDEDYKKIYQYFLKKYEKEFRELPAAKSVHHGFGAGLLMHTVHMMKLADTSAAFYPGIIDRDLLLTGTLLHDIAKKDEFSISDLGLADAYTNKGSLLGHLYMGGKEVAKAAEELGIPEDKSTLLEHMVISHHGKQEYGAVKPPLTAEAELLSLVDGLDATMEQYAEQLPQIEENTFSSRPVFGLGKRIFHPAGKEQKKDSDS